MRYDQQSLISVCERPAILRQECRLASAFVGCVCDWGVGSLSLPPTDSGLAAEQRPWARPTLHARQTPARIGDILSRFGRATCRRSARAPPQVVARTCARVSSFRVRSLVFGTILWPAALRQVDGRRCAVPAACLARFRGIGWVQCLSRRPFSRAPWAQRQLELALSARLGRAGTNALAISSRGSAFSLTNAQLERAKVAPKQRQTTSQRRAESAEAMPKRCLENTNAASTLQRPSMLEAMSAQHRRSDNANRRARTAVEPVTDRTLATGRIPECSGRLLVGNLERCAFGRESMLVGDVSPRRCRSDVAPKQRRNVFEPRWKAMRPSCRMQSN